MTRIFFFVYFFILTVSINYIQEVHTSAILEEPKTQYVLIGKNATFTCKSSGVDAHWTINHTPMTITYQQQKQDYEDKGVVFPEDVVTQEYYNITLIIHASMELNNTVIFCTVIRHFYSNMSEEVRLIVFNTLRPYPPGLNVNISYSPPENPQIKVIISEIPRWPGYETLEFKMNITNTEDNTLLGRYNASAENSTVKIQASLPDSVINKCVTLKFLATAVSEQYGESEANEAFAELYKTPEKFTDQSVTPSLLLPHIDDSLFPVLLNVQLPDVCRNQQVNYSLLIIENDNSSEVVGPYSHKGPGNVSHLTNILNKNNSYSVVVQVESIAGNRNSIQTYLNTSNKRSCSTEDTTVKSLDNLYTPMEQFIAESMPEHKQNLASVHFSLVITLALLVVVLIILTAVFVWFCIYHHKILRRLKKVQSYDYTSVKKVVDLLYDEIGELPQIAVATMTPSASDTNSPRFGTPAPLLSTHEQKFISNGKFEDIETIPNEVYGVNNNGISIKNTPNDATTALIKTIPNEVYGVNTDGIETTPNKVYGVNIDGIETTPNEVYGFRQ